MIEARIIADSISRAGKRIVTFELKYQRFIHGEVMTHRMFSRNAMSSRAIPVAKMIQQVREDPAMPVHWGKNQPGMQANEQLTDEALMNVQLAWREAAHHAADYAESMTEYGAHKQVANRILEPFQWMRTLVTATEWDNFFELRAHPDAQPEFQVLALAMRKEMDRSWAIERPAMDCSNEKDAWHLPFVSDNERDIHHISDLLKLSTARCARVSYLTHGGEKPRFDQDILLHDRLVGSVPIHASPTEHAAVALDDPTMVQKNFVGWLQYRNMVENKIRKT